MCDFAKLGSGILAYVCNFVFLVGLVWQKKLSAKEVQELVKGERNVPLIIDFYATWCGPCILMAQELEMVGCYFYEKELSLGLNVTFQFDDWDPCLLHALIYR